MSEGAESSEQEASERLTTSAMPGAEAREGYKWVQLGPKSIEIPEEWGVMTIEEVAERFISGGTPDSEKKSYWGGEIPWTTCATVKGLFFNGCKSYITDEGLRESSASLVPEGSILFGTRVNVANVAKTLQEVAISQDLTGVVLDEGQVEADFVTWYLTRSQKNIRAQYRQGSTIQGMLTSDLKSLKLPLPPLTEQRRIADILSKVDEQIQNTDSAIPILQSVREGSRRKTLLGEHVQSETQLFEIGPVSYKIPNNWDIMTLEELSNTIYRYPNYYDIDYVDSGVPEVRSEMIQPGGKISQNGEDLRYISSETSEEYPKTVLKKGDILLTVRGAKIGKVGYVDNFFEEGNINPNLIRISLDDRIKNSYARELFLSNIIQHQVEMYSYKTTMETITSSDIRDMQIPLPPIEYQNYCVGFFKTISDRIELKRKRSKLLGKLKQGLTQDLLTGTVRVPESSEAED